MAAVFWRLVLLGQLAIAAVAGWRVHSATGRMLLAAVAAAGVICVLQLVFVWASYAIGKCGPSWLRLRVAAAEAGCFALTQLEMACVRRRDCGGTRGAETRGRRPVLFIHGILCNGAVWRALARRLSAAGFGPLRALDLEPTTGDIASHAPRIAAEVGALSARSGGAPVSIVAHSMGGLVARAALPHCRAGDIGGLVTIATPHHGSRQARFGPGVAARQMRRGSEFLVALNALRLPTPPVTSLFSPDDNLVAPAASPVLPGARNLELRGLGHFALLRSRRAAAQVIAALQAT